MNRRACRFPWGPFDYFPNAHFIHGDTIMRTLATLAVLALAAAAQAADSVPAVSTAPIPQGSYSLDKAHTSLVFRVSHLGFSAFTARFTRYDARLDFNPEKLADSSVNVTIDPKSISADNVPDDFLEALSGEQWLDAAKFPEMKFTSRSVEVGTDGRFRIRGELTLHGVTRPLTLEARYNGGYAGHTYEPRARVGFSARGTFKRSDFGVSYGVPAPGTVFGVGDEVEVQLETEFSGPALKVAQR
jgi:polyisoprenoid-binding protein YceI